jgi:5-methylcytosine-specific restriction endonuclease McrA
MSVRIGKEGIVRRTGKDMDKLRMDCWNRDDGRCQECSKRLFWETSWEGHPDRYHMAHIRNKRMYGDTLQNVRALCGDCHRAEHGNPLPKEAA